MTTKRKTITETLPTYIDIDNLEGSVVRLRDRCNEWIEKYGDKVSIDIDRPLFSGDSIDISLQRPRLETKEEQVVRIEKETRRSNKIEATRRATYEALKKEFE